MATMNVSLPDPMKKWVESRMMSGQYANASDYVRDLIRRDQQESEKTQVLKAAIQEGLDSGISNRNVKDIMQGVEQRLRANGTLPPNKESR